MLKCISNFLNVTLNTESYRGRDGITNKNYSFFHWCVTT